MKKMIGMFVAIVVFGLMQHTAFAAADAAKGLWKTTDDVTGKPKAIVMMTETPGHTLQGTIVKIFPRPGFDQNELCTACKGRLHNQRIVGMTILTDLTADQENHGRWNGGEILDPHNGKTYRCTIQLTDQDQKMNVRGYIGLPLFGRSQVWQLVKSLND